LTRGANRGQITLRARAPAALVEDDEMFGRRPPPARATAPAASKPAAPKPAAASPTGAGAAPPSKADWDRMAQPLRRMLDDKPEEFAAALRDMLKSGKPK
jgi:hypothetical protein